MTKLSLSVASEYLMAQNFRHPNLTLLIGAELFNTLQEHGLVQTIWRLSMVRKPPREVYFWRILVEVPLPRVCIFEIEIVESLHPFFLLLLSGHFIDTVVQVQVGV